MEQDRSLRPPSRLKMLIFSLITTVLFFSIAELAARAVFPHRCGSEERLLEFLKEAGLSQSGQEKRSLTKSIPMPYDPYLIWHLIPGFQGENLGTLVEHNSRGLRTPEIPLEKPKNTRRIAMLGDSTIYGHGVETDKIMRTLLEQRLQRAIPRMKIEVVNGGVPGYSSLQSLNLLRRVLARYEPDVVVVFNLWSDCIFDQFEDKEVIYGGGAMGAINRWGQDLDEWLAPHSALYCGLKKRVFKIEQKTCAGRPPLCAIPSGDPPPDGGGAGANQVRQPGASTPQKGVQRVSQEDYRDNLHEIASFAHGIDAEVLFVIPVNRRDVGEQDDRQPTPEQYLPYRRIMREMASDLGAPLVDLPAAFEKLEKSGGPYFMDLVHPTAAGNVVMAERVGEAILQDPAIMRALGGQ